MARHRRGVEAAGWVWPGCMSRRMTEPAVIRALMIYMVNLQLWLSFFRRRFQFLCLGMACLFPVTVSADLSSAKVRMQEGSLVNLIDLPWIQLLLRQPVGKKFINSSHFNEYVLYAPPRYCPYGYYWAWGVNADAIARDSCNKSQRSKLSFLIETERSICDCSPILKTVDVANLSKTHTLISMNDELLRNPSFRLPVKIKDGSGELVQALLSANFSDSPGLYDYRGNPLCSFDLLENGALRDVPIHKALDFLFNSGDRSSQAFNVSCAGNNTGRLLFKNMRYSVLSSKFQGFATVEFPNGEKIEIIF